MMKKISVMNLLSLFLILLLALCTACEMPLSIDVSMPTGSLADSGNTTPTDTDWSILPAKSPSPVLPSIADVVATVKPSVVAINTETTFNAFRSSFNSGGSWFGVDHR